MRDRELNRKRGNTNTCTYIRTVTGNVSDSKIVTLDIVSNSCRKQERKRKRETRREKEREKERERQREGEREKERDKRKGIEKRGAK